MSTYLFFYYFALFSQFSKLAKNHLPRHHSLTHERVQCSVISIIIIIFIIKTTVRPLHLGGNSVDSMLKRRFEPG